MLSNKLRPLVYYIWILFLLPSRKLLYKESLLLSHLQTLETFLFCFFLLVYPSVITTSSQTIDFIWRFKKSRLWEQGMERLSTKFHLTWWFCETSDKVVVWLVRCLCIWNGLKIFNKNKRITSTLNVSCLVYFLLSRFFFFFGTSQDIVGNFNRLIYYWGRLSETGSLCTPWRNQCYLITRVRTFFHLVFLPFLWL